MAPPSNGRQNYLLKASSFSAEKNQSEANNHTTRDVRTVERPAPAAQQEEYDRAHALHACMHARTQYSSSSKSLSSPSVRTHSTEAAAEKKLQPQIYTQSMQMHTYKQCPRYQVAPPGNGGQNYLIK